MVANNKEDFLFQLHNELHRIGIDDDEDIFADFEEHFKASANEGLSEEETCRRLGDVKEIARNYVSIESTRINSILADAVEQSRPHVSLKKPGRDVPADLSLVSDGEEQHLPEYTPEHFSEEIYPGYTPRPNFVPDHTVKHDADPAGSAQSASAEGSESGTDNSGGTSSSGGTSGSTTGSSANQTVAEAFGAAGRAVADAAKVTGQAIADAFGEGIKNAGKTAAEAVKNAAEKAKAQATDYSVPEPVDHSSGTATATHADMPEPDPFAKPAGSGKGGKFTFSDFKGMSMKPDAGKLFVALLLDFFLWWWLIIMLGGIAFGLGVGGFLQFGAMGLASIVFNFFSFNILSRIFLGVAFISLGVLCMLFAILIVKAIIALIKNIIMMHLKALFGV